MRFKIRSQMFNFGLLVGVVVAATYGQSGSTLKGKQQQDQVCAILGSLSQQETALNKASLAGTPIEKARFRRDHPNLPAEFQGLSSAAARQLREVMGDGTFEGWRGQLNQGSTMQGHITGTNFYFGCMQLPGASIQVGYFGPPYFDGYQRNPTIDSPLANEMASLKAGQEVLVSGKLIQAMQGKVQKLGYACRDGNCIGMTGFNGYDWLAELYDIKPSR